MPFPEVSATSNQSNQLLLKKVGGAAGGSIGRSVGGLLVVRVFFGGAGDTKTFGGFVAA